MASKDMVLKSAALYTISWITTLANERAAALVMLDERHGKPKDFVKAWGDTNIYAWGRLGEHNIVIASLPAGVHGLVSAAGTVHGLMSSLPHIRLGLLVGIGAGVPTEDTLLLGDVVVSIPDGTNGGVVQYDLYKAKRETGSIWYERKGSLNSPPTALLNTLTALQAEHMMSPSKITHFLQAVSENDIMRGPFGFPGSDKDTLRKTSATTRTTPAIHYGTIASGNVLIKDSSERDNIIAWLRARNVHPLCFEMEAAGVMNSFPCLVIRGICDYADEHKNDIWQNYAAATAAAFAKELLGHIDAVKVADTATIRKVSSAVDNLRIEVSETISDVRSDHTHNRELSQLQARLNTANGASFNARSREHAATCLQDTRLDLLEQIFAWTRNANDKCIFWLCGKAGMGKSTIARTVAQRLHDSQQLGASFFFKRGEDDRKDASKFFTTITMQLTERVTSLRKSVVEALDADSALCGKSLKHQFEKLLLKPIAALPHQQTSSQEMLTIVIDALDECENEEDVYVILTLLARLREIESLRFRIFVTSRPELPVQLGFCDLDSGIHHDIKLETVQASTISHDIRIYFEHQFAAIRKKHSLRSYEKLPVDWPGEEQIAALVELAVPLFIFAFTICRYIMERSPQRRLQTILKQNNSFGLSELGKTYVPVLQQIVSRQGTSEHYRAIREFKDIVGPIVLLADPLSAESLSGLLEIPIEDIAVTLSHLHSVLDIPKSRHDPIRLLHLSFRDFLVAAKDEAAQEFCIDEALTHKKIAEQCLRRLEQPQALKQDLCDLMKPGIQRAAVDKRIVKDCIAPDVAYACLYWASHALQGGQDLCDEDRIHQWLKCHFLHWLEALSWLGRLSNSITYITELQSHVRTSEGAKISAFLNDALRFLLMNRYVIDLAPLQLYHSAMVFTPTESIVKKTFIHEAPTTFSLLPRVPSRWSAERQKLEGHEGGITAVAFSPNSKLIASASGDRTVRLWDATTGEQRQKFEGHYEEVIAVAFSLNSKLLTSVSFDQTVRIWDVASGQERQRLTIDDDITDSVALSPDGEQFALVSDGQMLQVWDIARGKQRQKLKAYEKDIEVLVFSPDGKLLALALEDYTVRVWDIARGEERQKLEGHESSICSVAFSSDGKQLVSASDDLTLRVWDIASGKQRQKLEGYKRSIVVVAFSPNGKLLASATYDSPCRQLWILSIATGEILQELRGHDDPIYSVVFSPNGKLLASAADELIMRIWDVAASEDTQMLERHGDTQRLEGHEDFVNVVAISTNGELVASASAPASFDHTVSVWDTSTGEHRLKLTGHEGFVRTVAFSPNSKLIASGAGDGRVRVWDAVSGEQRQMIKAEGVGQIEFSPDGKSLRTDVGEFELDASTAAQGEGEGEGSRPDAELHLKYEWLQRCGEDILWLPHEYRGYCSAAVGNTLVIGQNSGALSIFRTRSGIFGGCHGPSI